MTKSEHANKIHETLKEVEATHRAHGRAVAQHHAALAAAVNECGWDIGLKPDIIAAAAPKNPPPDES